MHDNLTTPTSFIFLALIRAQSSHIMDQVSYRLRGCLIHRIHALSIQPADLRIANAGSSAKAATLASSDVVNVTAGLNMAGESLTSAITVGVGAYLLWAVVGPVFVGPLVLAILSVAVPVLLGGKLKDSQRRSLEATEARLRATGRLVADARSLRVGGVQDIAAEEVLSRRRLEIDAALLYRKIFILVILAGELHLHTRPVANWDC